MVRRIFAWFRNKFRADPEPLHLIFAAPIRDSQSAARHCPEIPALLKHPNGCAGSRPEDIVNHCAVLLSGRLNTPRKETRMCTPAGLPPEFPATVARQSRYAVERARAGNADFSPGVVVGHALMMTSIESAYSSGGVTDYNVSSDW